MIDKLNTTQIELASVGAVVNVFNFSETLTPDIPTFDKKPVWDGQFYLYKSGTDKINKLNMIGTIPVQVKGRQFNDFSNSSIKHEIDINDVSTYQRNRGVAFFVVYVNAETRATKIYYRLLAPIELRKIAKNAGNKKETRIDFQELPEVIDRTVELQFLDFYNDCLKQQSFSDQQPIHIQDVEKDIKSFNVQFSAQSDSEYEAIKNLTTNPHFCYVRFKGDPTETLHPLGESRFNFIAQKKANLPVVIDGIQYFDEVGFEMKKGRTYIVIADVLRIPFAESPEDLKSLHSSNISLEFKTLSQRIKCFEFLMAAKINGEFSVGKWTISVYNIDPNVDFERTLKADKRLQSIFDRLKVKDDLIIENISAQDENNANTLIDYYLLGKRVTSSIKSDHNFVRIDINNINLQFLAEKIEEPDSYKLTSIHDLSDFVFTTMNDMGYHVQIPAFCMFNTQTFQEVCNISFNTFLEDCQKTMSNDNRFFQAVNWSILRMLNAYDMQEKKKHILIETAFIINNWLIKNDPDGNSKLTHLLNRLQITKRMNGLSNNDRELLLDIIDANNSNDEIKFACYTLLDNKESAARYFNRLTPETRSFYETMPLYNVYKSMSN